MIDASTWNNMKEKEDIKKTFDLMIDNNESYLGKVIFDIVKKFTSIKYSGVWVADLDIIDGWYLKGGRHTKYPIADDVYYFLIKHENGEIGVKRDLEKSPRINHKK